MSRADAEDHGYDVLRMLDLEELYYRKPVSSPEGKQQRVSIARAVANDPAIILGRRANREPRLEERRRGLPDLRETSPTSTAARSSWSRTTSTSPGAPADRSD